MNSSLSNASPATGLARSKAWVSQPERTPNAWDFWGALDGRMKAGISYMVTIAVEPFAPVEVRLVTEKVLKVEPK